MFWAKKDPVNEAKCIADLRNYSLVGEHKTEVSKHLTWLMKVSQRYSKSYFCPLPQLASPTTLSDHERGVLSALYDSSLFKYIALHRHESKVHTCPYCGLPNGTTLDHYLPRTKNNFPHLSFFASNLVPSCQACQNLKRTFFYTQPNTKANWSKRRLGNSRVIRQPAQTKATKKNTARIAHPYLDKHINPEKIYVKFDLDLGMKPKNFRLEYSDRFDAVINFHIKTLQLNTRVTAPFDLEWSAIPDAIRAHHRFRASNDEIRKVLQGEAALNKKKHGDMNMISKFYEALIRSEASINALKAASWINYQNISVARSRKK